MAAVAADGCFGSAVAVPRRRGGPVSWTRLMTARCCAALGFGPDSAVMRSSGQGC